MAVAAVSQLASPTIRLSNVAAATVTVVATTPTPTTGAYLYDTLIGSESAASMPTLASLGFPPALCSRLVVATGPATDTTTVSAPVNGSNRTRITPQALLTQSAWRLLPAASDDTTAAAASPPTAAAATPVAVHEVQALRQQVAAAWIAHTAMGQRLRHIHKKISTIEPTADAEPGNSTSRPSKRLRLDGFISVADLSQWESTLSNGEPRLSSGLASLDALVGDRIDTRGEGGFPPFTTHDGLAWGNMLHLSGPAASGKTQLALQWMAAAVGVRTTYLAGVAGPSLATLAQRLASLNPQRLADTTLDSFRDETELALALAAVEQACVHHPDAPWLLVVDGVVDVTGARSDQSRLRRRLARLARLYHGIGIVVGGRASTMALGTVHLRLSPPVAGADRLHGRLEEHPRSAKVGQTLQLSLSTTGVAES